MTEIPHHNLEVAQVEASKRMIFEWLGMVASGEYFARDGKNNEESLGVQETAAEFEQLLNEGHIFVESKDERRFLFAGKVRGEELGRVRLILNVDPSVIWNHVGLSRDSEFEESENMGLFINEAVPNLVDRARALAEKGLLK